MVMSLIKRFSMKQWVINILIGVGAVLSPIVPLFATVCILIACDFVFGLYRAYKTNQEISSRKMGHTISKVLLYNIAVLTVFMIEKYVMDGNAPYAKIIVGVIAMVELKSIDESFKLIFGYSLYDSFKDKLKRGASETK